MKKWEQLIAKLDNEQSDMVIGLIKDNIKGQMEEQSAEKKIDESNTGEKNGGQSNADMSQKVQTPEKPLLKEMADSTTKGSCFEPHYEPCKHPGCPYRKPPMGVGYEASERMKTKHVRHLKKRKLFNDSNDGSVEDNVGTGTLMESEMELPKKVSGGNADKHFSGGNKLTSILKGNCQGQLLQRKILVVMLNWMMLCNAGHHFFLKVHKDSIMLQWLGKGCSLLSKKKKRKTESVKLMMKQRRRVMV